MTLTRRSRMSAVDTAWLRMDRPGNPMTIVGLMTTATPVPLADFRQLLEQRFLKFDRFRQRPVTDAFGAAWVADPQFDLDRHIVVQRRPPRTDRQLQQLAARLAATPLDPARPRWQIHFVAHFGRGSAWILRIHHCYADGIAMIRVLLSMTEAADERGTHRGRRRPRRRLPSVVDLLPVINWVMPLPAPMSEALEGIMARSIRTFERLLLGVLTPGTTARRAQQAGGIAGELVKVLAAADEPRTPLRGPLSGRKAVAWSEPLALERVHTTATTLGCTINDVLMSTIAGALGGYLRARRHDTEGLVIRATVPVNLRAPDGPLALGNEFGLVFVELPIGVRNPLERVYALHASMAALKGSMQPAMVLAMLNVLGTLPAPLQTRGIDLFSGKATAVVSNVPGPRTPLTIAGQRVSRMLFWVPQSGSIGLGISVLTYAGQVHFGMIADRAIVANPAAVVKRFEPELARLERTIDADAIAAAAGD